jgi:hypothetical protein
MKVSMENDNNFGYEKITIVVDNIPLIKKKFVKVSINVWSIRLHKLILKEYSTLKLSHFL